jgi:hypothetical protein
MAIDMSDGGQRGWFGFSPAVVVAVFVFLFGGGVVVAKSRSTTYREAVAEICAASIELKTSDGFTNPGTDIISSLVRLSKLHLEELAKLDPSGPDLAIHQDLVASEQRFLAIAGPQAARYGPLHAAGDIRGMQVAGFMDDFKATYALAREQDARYERASGAKHCSD